MYTGVTNSLRDRIYEHKSMQNENSFTSKYGVTKLIYFENFALIEDAIAREKFIKGKSRK